MKLGQPTPGRASVILTKASLALLLVAALALRLHGLNWDQGQLLHPDERHLADVATHRLALPPDLTQLFDADTSPLNPRSRDPITGAPRSFAYGSLPLYLLRGTAAIVTVVTGTDWSDFLKIPLVGRVLSALFDTGTIWLVFLIGRRLRDRRTGLLAAAFVTFAVIHIQLAHFFAVDTMLVFLITACLTVSLGVIERPTGRRALLGGLLYGLALATKASSAPLLIALAAPYLFWWLGDGADTGRAARLRSLWQGTSYLTLALVVAAATFALLEPYALLAPGAFLGDLTSESEMARGIRDLPYTRQFVGTIPIVYQLAHQIPWTLGIPLGLIGLTGFFASLWRVLTRWVPREAVLMSWAVPYLVITLSFEAKFLRYLLPVVPIFAVLGSRLLVELHDRARRRARRLITIPGTLAWLGLAGTVIWALAFSTIYDRPHTRVQASEWIYANVAAGARLGIEHWDDALPLPLPGGETPATAGLQQVTMQLYDDHPPQEEYEYITGLLRETDYIILSSNRLYASIPRLPWRYAVTSEYYRLLFQGSLGFAPAATFTSTPGLFGLKISDRGADESFTVYDHPTVYIFKKVRTVPDSELRPLFAEALSRPWLPTRYGPTDPSLLLDQPVDQLPSVTDYAWSGLSPSSWLSVLVWYLVLAALGLLALPLALAAGRGLPDRAYPLARPLGLLLVGYLVWLLASLHLVPFLAISAWVIAGIIALVLLRSARRLDLATFLRTHGREIVAYEMLFAGAFLAFTAIRLLNPDLWHPWNGGEKPMELAFVNAITRGTSFPPYDPWYSDGYLNGYYYGYYLVALLARLTGLPPALALNLAVPTFFAFTVSAASSIAGNLVGLIGRKPFPRPALRWGLLGAVLVVGMGNLEGVLQALQPRGGINLVAMVQSFDYWRASQIVPFTTNEFPFWSFLFADLHPDLIALPFGLVVVGLLLALVQGGGAPASGAAVQCSAPVWRMLSPHWARAGALALLLGALACLGPWYFPLYLGLIVLAGLMIGVRHWKRSGPRALLIAGGIVLIIGTSAVVGYLPFFIPFRPFYDGLRLVATPTGLPDLLVMFGLFLYIVVGLLGQVVYRRVAANRIARREGSWNALGTWPWGGVGRSGLLAIGVIALPAALVGLGRPASALLMLLLEGILLAAWRGHWPDSGRFALLLMAIGLLILLGGDTFYLADAFQDTTWRRLHTVLSLSLQAWVFLALGSAVALYLLMPRPGTNEHPSSARKTTLPSWLSLSWTVGLAGLLTAGLLFVPLGTISRVRDRFPSPPPGGTLDGLAYMATASLASPGQEPIALGFDLQAIAWMTRHLSGTPVVLEASLGPYRGGGSRISSGTGFPTVLGWDSHERQQRYPAAVDRRLQDVRTVYNSPDVAATLAVLSAYHVEYVYVGEIERRTTLMSGQAGARTAGEPYASPAGLSKLESMVGIYLDIAYGNPGVHLYRVRPPYSWPDSPPGVARTDG